MTISRAEFTAKAREIAGFTDKALAEDKWGYLKKDWDEREGYLKKEWMSGGVGGGSCWDTGDDDPHHPISGDVEPPFEELDKLLELVAPKMTFMIYRRLEREIMETDSRSRNEYYGNYTEYAIRKVSIDKLYDFLVEANLL